MLNFTYSYKLHREISDNLISQESLPRIFQFKDNLILVSIAAMTQFNFKKIDKEFQYFGKWFWESFCEIEPSLSRYERELIFDSISKLMLNNIGFANTELFPDVDIQMIDNKLQIELLMKGMYFRLLPNVLIKCKDIKFHFQ
jgi:hypothetical protein